MTISIRRGKHESTEPKRFCKNCVHYVAPQTVVQIPMCDVREETVSPVHGVRFMRQMCATKNEDFACRDYQRKLGIHTRPCADNILGEPLTEEECEAFEREKIAEERARLKVEGKDFADGGGKERT
jgi:hypothetical protein